MSRLIDLLLVAAVVLLAALIISECSEHRSSMDAEASLPSEHRGIDSAPSTVEAMPMR